MYQTSADLHVGPPPALEKRLWSAGGFLVIKCRLDYGKVLNIKRYVFKYIFFLLLKHEGSKNLGKAFDWCNIMEEAGLISSLLFLKDLAWLIKKKKLVEIYLCRKSLSWLSISLSSWVYLSTNFKVPWHHLSQLRWQDFTCKHVLLQSAVSEISKIILKVGMKFGLDVCKSFYSGVSNLGIFILDDLVTHKYL